jgi:SpoVK/Ycf46/Vps4 family AAA+-type ATPase
VSDSDPVVSALRAALAASDGCPLRLALGKRLLELGRAADALAELERALAFDPADRDALEAAARAATAAGDAARAQAYTLALSAHRAPPSVGEPAPEPRERPHLRLVEESETPAAPDPDAVTFEHVGGLDDVKQRLHRSFLLPLKQPEVFARFGKSVRGGLLLYGPPGCGKTFIARALAGEIGARFMSIGLSDVLDMWLGESERKLHELFENARRQAPTVLFFDEVDALGQRRTQLKHSAGRTIVNQLLAEMDGIGDRNRDLFVLGATNHPWDIDPALRRPGRFDRMVFVPAPDLPARERILSLKLAGRPTAPTLDLKNLARRADGFSGADLQALVDAATELAFEQTVASGRERPIDDALLAAALKDLRPSAQPWLETARNYAIYANEGGAYDDLLAYLKTRGMA